MDVSVDGSFKIPLDVISFLFHLKIYVKWVQLEWSFLNDNIDQEIYTENHTMTNLFTWN